MPAPRPAGQALPWALGEELRVRGAVAAGDVPQGLSRAGPAPPLPCPCQDSGVTGVKGLLPVPLRWDRAPLPWGFWGPSPRARRLAHRQGTLVLGETPLPPSGTGTRWLAPPSGSPQTATQDPSVAWGHATSCSPPPSPVLRGQRAQGAPGSPRTSAPHPHDIPEYRAPLPCARAVSCPLTNLGAEVGGTGAGSWVLGRERLHPQTSTHGREAEGVYSRGRPGPPRQGSRGPSAPTRVRRSGRSAPGSDLPRRPTEPGPRPLVPRPQSQWSGRRSQGRRGVASRGPRRTPGRMRS